MSYTKSTPSLDDLEPGLYYRNLPLRTEPLHKSAKSLMAVYEKDEYGEWSTYRGRGIPDCDAEAVALHHLAEYHERGGLFRLSFSATPTNGAGSRTTYEPGQKVITEAPGYFWGARLEGEYLYFKPSGALAGSLHKVQVTSPFTGKECALNYYDNEIEAIEEQEA